MNMDYLFIVLVLLTVVALAVLAAWIRGKKRRGAWQYDERQRAQQGRSARWAFFTLLVYLVAVGLAWEAGLVWCEPGTGLFLGALLGAAVYGIRCLATDAYFKAGDSPVQAMAIFAVLGVLDLSLGILHMVEGDFLTGGVLGVNSLSFFVGLMLLAAFAAAIVRRVRDRNEAE